MVKVALVGVGGMGSTHFNIYNEMKDVKIVALVDIRPEKIEDKALLCGAKTYTDISDMLQNHKPDIVDICTPTYLHSELAIQALSCGCNVISEKPAALSQDEIRDVYRCAKENNVYFMAAHVIRFWAEYNWLKETVQKQTYGELKAIRFWRIGEKPTQTWKNWMLNEKKSGMVPFDLHIHDVDYIIYLLGMPKEVDAFEIRDGQKTNYINAGYIYPNGVHVTAEAAWYTAKIPFSMGYTAIFEKGVAEYKDEKLTVYPNGEEPFDFKFNVDINAQSEINVSNVSGYYNEIKYFIDCVVNNREPAIIKEQELIDTLELINREIKR